MFFLLKVDEKFIELILLKDGRLKPVGRTAPVLTPSP